MPAINGNIFGLASRVFGQSVQGAGQLPGAQRSGLASAMDTVFGVADNVLNNGKSTQTSALLGTLRQGVGGFSGFLGLEHPGDPIGVTASSRTQLNLFQAKEQTLDQRIKDAQARASSGDPAARQQLATLQVQKQQTHVQMLGVQAQSSGTYVGQVQSELTRQFAQSAGWERYLADDAAGVDPLADARAAKTPEQRAQVNDRIMVALGVGVAKLDHLRAQIQYYEYLEQTGQLKPDQQSQLDQLRTQFTGSTQQLEVLRRAREQFQQENHAQLTQLRVDYTKTEQKVGRLVETEERLSGRSIATGKAVDWSQLTEAQKQQEMHAATGTVRALNQQAVEHHDVSGYRQLEQVNLQHWDTFQVAMDREDSQRRDDQRAEEQRYEQKRQAEKAEIDRLNGRRQSQGSEVDRLDRQLQKSQQEQAAVQQFVAPLRQEESQSYQAYLSALDQSHAQSKQLAQQWPRPRRGPSNPLNLCPTSV